MSIDVMAYVWKHSRHKGSELLTLLAIADHADDNGYAYPAIARLAEKTRMTERNVQFVLKKLEASQEITLRRNAGPHGCHVFQVTLATRIGITAQCELCKEGPSESRRLDRHHILPRAWGGPDTLSNLMDLCQQCHRDIHTHLGKLRTELGSPSLAMMGVVLVDKLGEDFSLRDWAYQFRKGEKISPENFSGEKITGEKSDLLQPQISPKPSLESSEDLNPSVSSLEETSPQGDDDARRPQARRGTKRGDAPTITPRARRCPEAYEPSAAVRAWAAQEYPEVCFDAALAAMRDWEFKTPKTDWDATLRNWIREEARRSSHGARHATTNGSLSPMRDYVAERQAQKEQRRQRFVEGGQHGRHPSESQSLLDRDGPIIDRVEYRYER